VNKIVQASAKSGIGIDDILESIVKYVPPPKPDTGGPFRALIFDSLYDPYRGVIVFMRVMDGAVKRGDAIRFLNSRAEHDVVEVGIMQPNQVPVDCLRAGEVGYLCASIRDVLDARVGDTIVLSSEYKAAAKLLEPDSKEEPITPLPGYQVATPMVFAGVFPVDADQYENLRDALGKMRLNDAAITYEPETSGAMGFGFRCGFLGLLHMDVVRERLEREYDLDLIVTAPTVVYKVRDDVSTRIINKGIHYFSPIPDTFVPFCFVLQVERGEGEKKTVEIVDTPSKMPEIMREMKVFEPYVKVEILTPSEYNGQVIELGQERRGILIDIKYLTPTRSTIVYEIPLAEVITDFFDQLKSRTQGYASMEYQLIEYRPGNLVRLDVKINYEDAPPLATIVHVDAAQMVGRRLVESLKELIPRQMFKVPIQACIGVKVIASAVISPMRKDVLAKCYGGDISRKKKLLKKQAKGKKRMKLMGKVNVPQEAFMAVIKLDKSAGN
jgi:GTP-binding protein LepA